MNTIFCYITWDVHPDIFTLGPLKLHWYGLLFASGFLAGLFIVRKMFEAEGAPEPWLDKAFIYIVLGAVIGARLGHVFFYDWPYYSQHLSEIPMVWKGGLASHGGAIGILIAVFLFSVRVSKKSMLWILDKIVVPTALAGCFIRLGNLMNSEIVGVPTDVPWAFKFVNGRSEISADPRHPVQLYESISYLLIFFVLFRTYWKTNATKKPGFVFGLFLVLVFSARFVLEYYKNSQGGFQETLGVFSTGQWLSIPFVLVGLVYILRPNPNQGASVEKLDKKNLLSRKQIEFLKKRIQQSEVHTFGDAQKLVKEEFGLEGIDDKQLTELFRELGVNLKNGPSKKKKSKK